MGNNLIQSIPSSLQNALNSITAEGEDVMVSLPGSIGEALIVTDRRVIITRDSGMFNAPNTYIYPFSKISDINVGSTPVGGTLSVVTDEPIDGDQGTVQFPSYKLSDFEAAAGMIKELLGGNTELQPSNPTEITPLSPQAAACPKCGAAIGPNDAFCAVCGVQIRNVCQICSSGMPADAKFCPRCGSEAKPANLTCPSCGERANSSVITYCPKCGTALNKRCMSCGGSIVEGWPKCRYCGREIGSIDGVIRMASTIKNQEEDRSAPEPVAPMATATGSSAADYNARGAKFFEDDKIEEAIEAFGKAVELDPGNSSYHCNLAVAYDEADRDEEARREYERALQLNPADRTALLYLGYMLNEDDEPEQAAATWHKLIEIAPGSPEAEEAAQNLRAQDEI